MKKNKLSVANRIGWFILATLVAVIGIALAALFPGEYDSPAGLIILASIGLYVNACFTKKSIYETFTYRH